MVRVLGVTTFVTVTAGVTRSRLQCFSSQVRLKMWGNDRFQYLLDCDPGKPGVGVASLPNAPQTARLPPSPCEHVPMISNLQVPSPFSVFHTVSIRP
jgi:hypothetical protein